MEKPKRPYSLFKRPTVKQHTFIYYCRFRDENGKYMSPVSTLQFSKAAAQNWADQKLREGKIVLPGKRGTPFETFAEGFWDYQGEYIQRRIARGGHFSKIFSEIREGQVRKWIMPYFKGQPIGSIRQNQIESWAMELYKTSGLVPATVNRVIDCMKVMMKEALRHGYLNSDPAAGVESFAEKYKVRGIITPEEINLLFNKDALASVWEGERVYFAASLMGLATGLRQGEVRGLRNQDVHPEYVAVCGSWEERNGLHGAKWGSERIVPIPSRVADELDALGLYARYKDPEDLVFAGEGRGEPIKKENLETRFYAALEAIGVDEAARRKRVLVWHSLRHTFNSMMKGQIDAAKLMKVIGHRQDSTNFLYTHVLPQDLVEVRQIQENILGTARVAGKQE
jgi:site-specific recombinase XerD